MSYYGNIKEEELKLKVGEEWFSNFDTTGILGNVDFSVALRNYDKNPSLMKEYLLWAEAKKGTKSDIKESFVQLILTIGKEHTFDDNLPPNFIGAFDAEKIAFIPYNIIMGFFEQNDFNWNVAPSNHDTKEFHQLYNTVELTLNENALLFEYDVHKKELSKFIRDNFKVNKANITAIRINKNNFTHIYRKWLSEVKPSISIDWEEAKKEGIIDADFYLADILSKNNKSILEKLFVLLENDKYTYNKERKKTGSLRFESADFKDGQKAHSQFWRRYSRPPKKEYWNYIVDRRDLLVPQDIRERKGSFYTPNQWVELSQEYLARELGENWQDNYYIWDCCAGTGNLLAGLTNKWNIYASTLDRQDVDIMHELIEANSLNLLSDHVFQFDFLNDELPSLDKANNKENRKISKLPKTLQDIITDPEKRKKLIIYINPPYAEAATTRQMTGTGANKPNVARNNYVEKKYRCDIKNAVNELFAQFFIRIYKEIPSCVLAEFSKLKILQAPNFRDFRNVFRAKLKSLFIVPSNTFDNVKGAFPIGFHIWDTESNDVFEQIQGDAYNKDGSWLCTKNIYSYSGKKLLTDWMKTGHDKINARLSYLRMLSSDMQHQNGIFLTLTPSDNDFKQQKICNVTSQNLLERCIYFAVRHCIEATWLNDRDQFLYPNDSWKEDKEFQADCLAYTIFHSQNRISAEGGTNHWIPFTEEEVNAKERFESHFMIEYIKGQYKPVNEQPAQTMLDFGDNKEEAKEQSAISFSPEAQAVLSAGRELWRYYHKQKNANPNAALYDIRLNFQGKNDKGKMNNDSNDAEYTKLIKTLRSCLNKLAKKIEPKVYEHGFLLK